MLFVTMDMTLVKMFVITMVLNGDVFYEQVSDT